MKARSRSSIPTNRSKRQRLRQSEKDWTKAEVLRELKDLANPAFREKMDYFGIKVSGAHGISTPLLHKLSRRIGKNHALANELWSTGVHEAKLLAGLIAEADKVTASQMDLWARDFDSWDIVDGTCRYLYAFAAPAWTKIAPWSCRREEFVKRAAFSLMAYLSYLDRTASDEQFVELLPIIERESTDERNFVRKAVNWALRQIGKRNLRLNEIAIHTAEKIQQQDSRAARWIAADALRELKSEAVHARLRKKLS